MIHILIADKNGPGFKWVGRTTIPDLDRWMAEYRTQHQFSGDFTLTKELLYPWIRS